MPLKRCPAGTHRNKTTGACEPVQKCGSKCGPNTNKKGIPRCPPGTRRNKYTGNCDANGRRGIPHGFPLGNVERYPYHKYLHMKRTDNFRTVTVEYRKLALTYHPDKCPNVKSGKITKAECEDIFKQITEEYTRIKAAHEND